MRGTAARPTSLSNDGLMSEPLDSPEREPTRTIGERLREARRTAGLTQKEAAERIGVNRRTIWEWENNVRRPTTALPELAELYGVSALFLSYGPDPTSAEVAALRGDLIAIVDEIARAVVDVKKNVVTLAEATEAAFRELRDLIELRQRELGDSGEKPNGGR